MALVLEQLEARRAFVEQVQENSARLCRAGMFFETIGAGELVMTEPIMFGISFTKPPLFTHGHQVNSEIIMQHLPHASAFVIRWQMTPDSRLYLGAYLGFVVDDAGGDLQHRITHHLHFEGIALKVPLGAGVLGGGDAT